MCCKIVWNMLQACLFFFSNYIKRIREEQAAARRPSYRSTSIGLRSNSQSEQNNQNNAKDGRLEAALNKVGLSITSYQSYFII